MNATRATADSNVKDANVYEMSAVRPRASAVSTILEMDQFGNFMRIE